MKFFPGEFQKTKAREEEAEKEKMSYSLLTNIKHREGNGYRVYENALAPQISEYVFNGVTLELCYFVLGNTAGNLIGHYGLDITRAFQDCDFRSRLGISTKMVRRNGNSRESKVLKKSGKAPIYLSPYVRDGIRRNPVIHEIISSFYREQKLAFTEGLDPVIYKAKGSEESLPVLDCKLFEPLRGQNKFHYVCLVYVGSQSNSQSNSHPAGYDSSSGSSDEMSTEDHDSRNLNGYNQDNQKPKREHHGDDNGHLMLLKGFDVHYADLMRILDHNGSHPIPRKKKESLFTVLENFNLVGVNEALRNIHLARNGNQNIHSFIPLEWVSVSMNPGDVIVFDCRIPYKTVRNITNNPACFIPVSLRPVDSTWYGSDKHQSLVQSMKDGKVGDWKKRGYKECNLEEHSWRNKVEELQYSNMQCATDITTFNDKEKQMFGLIRY